MLLGFIMVYLRSGGWESFEKMEKESLDAECPEPRNETPQFRRDLAICAVNARNAYGAAQRRHRNALNRPTSRRGFRGSRARRRDSGCAPNEDFEMKFATAGLFSSRSRGPSRREVARRLLRKPMRSSNLWCRRPERAWDRTPQASRCLKLSKTSPPGFRASSARWRRRSGILAGGWTCW